MIAQIWKTGSGNWNWHIIYSLEEPTEVGVRYEYGIYAKSYGTAFTEWGAKRAACKHLKRHKNISKTKKTNLQLKRETIREVNCS